MEEIHNLSKDESFAPFIDPSFDPVKYASDVIHYDSAATIGPSTKGVDACLSKLSAFVTRIDGSIQTIITDNHKHLIDRVRKVGRIQTSLDNGARGLDNLMSSVDDIKKEVIVPYNQIKACTKKLEHMQLASDMLRSILRLSFSLRKVESQMATVKDDKTSSKDMTNMRDLAKTATSLAEVESIVADGKLKGINIVEEKMPWIISTGQDIRSAATRVLHASISSMNQSEIGNSLQVFHNLNCLDEKVQGAILYVANRVAAVAKSALDASAISQVAERESGGKALSDKEKSAALRATLWSRVDALMEAIISCTLQVWTFHRVLSKKKDMVTNMRYLDIIKRDRNSIIISFWDQMTSLLGTHMETASGASPMVRAILVSEYPRLREKLSSVLGRLHKNTSTVTRDKDAVVIGSSNYERDLLLNSVSVYLEAFLSRSLQRMNDPVIAMFPSNADDLTPRLPIPRDIQKLISVIATELNSAGGDVHLTLAIGKSVVKVVQLFASHIENVVKSDSTALDVSGGRTAAQKHNHTLLTLLEQTRVSVSRMTVIDEANTLFKSFEPKDVDMIAKTIAPSLSVISNLVRDIVLPYVGQVARRCEGFIMKMHSENHNLTKDGTFVGSVYLSDLEKEVNRLLADHLSKIPPSPTREKCYGLLVSRLLLLFVRHAALLRPLSEEGKLKLAQDMTTIEMIVSSIAPASSAGATYKELRAFKEFLFLDVTTIVDNDKLANLRPSTVFHQLLCRAPPVLQSPHQLLSISPEEYSRWVDAQTGSDTPIVNIELLSTATFQSEDAIWTRVRQCLDAYSQRMSAKRETSGDKYHHVYTMLQQGGAQLLGKFRGKVSSAAHV